MWSGLLFLIISGMATRSNADELSDFLKLNENLPKAVCDESLISRAPSFEAATELKKTSSELSFEARMPAAENEILSFLMGDQSTLIAAPQVLALFKAQSAGSISDLKRKVSLEVCTSMVTPGKLGNLLTAKPEWVIPVTLMEEGNKSSRNKTTHGKSLPQALFLLRDVEGRFGKFGSKWYIPGWVESYEAQKVIVGKRRYERLANTITNHTQFILMMKPDETPLGFFVPSAEPSSVNWKILKAQTETEGNQQRKMEIYRMLIELEAYRAVARAPNQSDAVRKLQEFYKNLIAAYQIYPNGEQFAQYAKRVKSGTSAESDARDLLDDSFLKAMEAARVNGNRVTFFLFAPDSKLAAILQEYRKRLWAL